MPDLPLGSGECDATVRTTRVLIVEDTALIALCLEDLLADMGWEAVGPASSVATACALARDADIDAAIVDVDLNGVMAWEVVTALQRRCVPFMLTTGYDRAAVVPNSLAGVPVIAKPFSIAEVGSQLRTLMAADQNRVR